MTAATATGEGPDDWCYDALESRRWPAADGDMTLLRSLELVWIHFDGNPACFANMVDGEQAIEDFLVGPPAAETPANVGLRVQIVFEGATSPRAELVVTPMPAGSGSS